VPHRIDEVTVCFSARTAGDFYETQGPRIRPFSLRHVASGAYWLHL